MTHYKLYYLTILFFSFFINNSYSLENKILFKVNGEIITYIDVVNEAKYLRLLNPKINELNNERIFEIAQESLISENIKKIEILSKYKKLNLNEDQIKPYLENTYKNLGFENFSDFEKYIVQNHYTLLDVKQKIMTELLWNEIIFKQFINKVKIDNKLIEKQLLKIKDDNIMLFLNEILLDPSTNIEESFNNIQNSIVENGFENTALIHSISNTAKSGGKIGWINKLSLNPAILKEIEKLGINEYSNPIRVQSGFLIIKISEIKKNPNQFNIEDERKKLINQKTNEQLQQFSNIYFNKIKKNISINES